MTAASPLIAQTLNVDYGLKTPSVCVNNAFSKAYQGAFRNTHESILRIFWFSQYVGFDRGLNDFFEALEYLQDVRIECGILGDTSRIDTSLLTDYFKSEHHSIKFYTNRSESELFALCQTYDVGLCLERSFPINKDICLANKIFTYAMCGNAMVLSNTQGHLKFMANYPDVGCVYEEGNPRQLASVLRSYWESSEHLQAHRKNAWTLADEKLNWDVEKEKLLSLISTVLN